MDFPPGLRGVSAWFHLWYIYNIRTATSAGQLKVPLPLLGLPGQLKVLLPLQVLVLLHLLTA